MPRKKPRWGWRYGPHGQNVKNFLTDQFLNQILDLVGAKNHLAAEEFEHYVHLAIETYFEEKIAPCPSSNEIRAALKVIQSHTGPLIKIFDRLDDRTKLFLNQTVSYPIAQRKKQISNISIHSSDKAPAPKKAIKLITHVEDCASALKKLEVGINDLQILLVPQKKGRRENTPLNRLIGFLWGAYETVGLDPKKKFTYDHREKIYWSPFIDFVAIVLRHIDPDHRMSNAAIGEKVRRYLGLRKPARG